MPTFIGPTQAFQYPTGNRLLDRMKPLRGVTVYSLDGGTTWKQALWPYKGDLQQGEDAAGGVSTSMVEGVDYFLGGHTYTISAATAAKLILGGYSAYVTGSDTYFDSYLEIY